MIDHISFAVSNMERSKTFYVAALKPLGIAVVMEVTAEQTGADAHAGFGKDDKAFFWIGGGAKPKGGTHVAFTAPTRADVDSFYRAALAAGGRDNGSPGASLPPGLLWRLRPRSRRQQHRSGVSPAGMKIQACFYPRLPAADFGLAGAAFLAAAFFGATDFALTPGLSAAPAALVGGFAR